MAQPAGGGVTTATPPSTANAARRRLASRLRGTGVEVGPGRYPFRLLPPGVVVRYVDRLGAGDRRRLSGDLGLDLEGRAHESAVADLEPDVVVDFNLDRLGPLADASQDFVIASHVLEHLAEPLGFLDEIHRVLRPGGLALVLLPDRRRTADRFRAPTPLSHLVGEHQAGVVEVSDEHILEFLADRGRRAGRSAAERSQVLERYREQSVHVHCWDAWEFADVLLWGIANLGQQWELVDASLYEPPVHYEFGFLLRRSEEPLDRDSRRAEFSRSWRVWSGDELARRPGLRAAGEPSAGHRWLVRRGRALAARSRPAAVARERAHGARLALARYRRRLRRWARRLAGQSLAGRPSHN